MKLWLISQNQNNDYDTYSDAVVAAETAEEAAKIHPGGPSGKWSGACRYGTWVDKPSEVEVLYIGDAAPGTKVGVICASFHAG